MCYHHNNSNCPDKTICSVLLHHLVEVAAHRFVRAIGVVMVIERFVCLLVT